MSCTGLLVLFFIFIKGQTESCNDSDSVAPKPNIPHLKAFSKKQSLVVTLPARHTDGESDIYEIQIGRTETQSIIYSRKVSVSAAAERTWTWISDLPLECVDHSVRIRYFCNQSAPSPWSNWTTNHGVKVKNTLRIFPSDRVLQEGKSATFCCVAPQGVKIASINFGNNHFPSTSIGATVEAITVNNLTIPTNRIKSSLLTCTEGTGKKVYAWNYVSFPPQKPQNLSCATSDMTTVVCNWNSGRKRDEFDTNTQTYSLHIEFPAVPQLQEYNISVMVKDELGKETESYSFNISERVLPELQCCRATRGVTNVRISWRVVGNLPQMMLICQVSATPGNITQQVDCNSSSHVCKAEVEHLHPSTEYSIVVRCSTNGKLWGNWSKPKLFKTYPLVMLELWKKIEPASASQIRHVTLMWNTHISDRAVSIQSYRVQWSQKDRMWTNVTDGRQNQLEVTIGPEKCNFTVEAILERGYRAAAHITIPPSERQEAQVVKRRLKSSSADGIILSWDKDRAVTCGYTVEWCTLGSAVPCTLKWIKVPKGNNSLFLSSKNFTAGLRYSFNIYGCTENGHKLLEVKTGYSQELKYVGSPSLVQPVQTTSSSATLEWLFNEHDPAHPAFIIGYLITVQGGRSDKAPDQATNVQNLTIADPLQKSVIIEGLQPNQEYVCSVSALTKEGPGPSVSVPFRTRINYPSQLAKFLAPVLLLLSCIVLLWPQRKKIRTGLKEMFAYPAGMNIKIPEFESFLDETIQRLSSQRIEECISCEIEILNVGASATARKPDFTNDLCSPGTHSSPSSTSASCISVQRGYCPQSAVVLVEKPTCLQMACVINKSYFSTIAESPSEIAADSI
ncbi:leukemia inhibitory factor receptor isoform X2 [Oryzias latipes]|uniref:leukemia inhibitory factor receptor isoform X2 n=1 Tax=Oryzias latipes TaxID=8090 RepID=UPI000CE1AE77|nr:leukemia inhibitory factor receptor isoform X2 [Oryzias latipes]